ncbi:MAG: biosynthetic-type acetolactate synthase large subunit [Candidatus Ancillula trichonymphae]|nr:biosynthetic-type acetolactate synthase large subunit [Candidatus Ancillula trichonymphae]
MDEVLDTECNGDFLDGSHILVRTLEDLGVDTVFGLPGGAILAIYDALTNSTKFRHILVRHEQGAGHAASGYAISSGKPGVVMVTSGPAATNMVTAIADANMDSVPLVVITGQVAANLIGTDAFQEADIVGITLPVVKHSFLVTEATEISHIVSEAFHIAATGRPGVVLVDITKTAMISSAQYDFNQKFQLPGFNPKQQPEHKCLQAATELVVNAKRPVILAGGGTLRAQASKELLDFANLIHAPVVTTLQARGIIPDSDVHSLGMIGMHGTIASAAAVQKCDLLIALGARFSDRVTGKIDEFAPLAKVIHADVDPVEIGKNRVVDAPLFGDLKDTLALLIESLTAAKYTPQDRDSWWNYLEDLQMKYPLYLDDEHAQKSAESGMGALSPQSVIQKVGQIAKKYDENAIFVSGVGQHQMWASQFLGHEKPHNWVQSAGLGTMGYAVPAALGAKAARQESAVWVIDGDGCFQMTNQELATCRLAGLPIKAMLINNGTLGMPRQWQTLLFDKHYSQTDLHDGPDGWSGEVVYGDGEEKGGSPNSGIPDFVTLAKAYDCLAIQVTRPEEVEDAIEKAAQENERSVVIEFVVAKDALVFPMVPAGKSNNSIMYTPTVQPLLDEESEELDG